MPGSSLWLLPPADHPLQGILGELIAEVSKRFGSTHLFVPHVTLTSEIEPGVYGGKAGAQKWLNGVEFPDSRDVVVRFGKLQSEDVFVRKLYVTVAKEGVKGIGGVARKFVGGEKEVESWVEERYRPHLSLLYHDCPKVYKDKIDETEKLVLETGVRLDGEDELGGWTGGRIVLVETDKAIADWMPIAEKTL